MSARGRLLAETSQRALLLEEALRAQEEEVAQLRAAIVGQARNHVEQEDRLAEAEQADAERDARLEAQDADLRAARRRLDALARDHDRWRHHVGERLAAIEKVLGIPSPETPAPETTPPELPRSVLAGASGVSLPEGLPGDAPGLLAAARKRLEAGETELARAILEHAISRHDASPEAPELLYRLGETWLREARWGQAVAAFQVVSEAHPKSDWAAWALLRQGESFREMGEQGTARIFFEDVLRLHPKSAAASQARRHLADGGAGGGGGPEGAP